MLTWIGSLARCVRSECIGFHDALLRLWRLDQQCLAPSTVHLVIPNPAQASGS
jgi:hypothetical protein